MRPDGALIERYKGETERPRMSAWSPVLFGWRGFGAEATPSQERLRAEGGYRNN